MKKIYKLTGILSLVILTSCGSIGRENIYFFGQNENNFIYRLCEKNGNNGYSKINLLNTEDYYKYERTSTYRSLENEKLTAVVKANATYSSGTNMRFKTGEASGSITLFEDDKIIDNKYYYCFVNDDKFVTFDNDDLYNFSYEESGKHIVLPNVPIGLYFLHYAKDDLVKYYSVDSNGDAYVDFDKVNRSKSDCFTFGIFPLVFQQGINFSVDESLKHLTMEANSHRSYDEISSSYDLATYSNITFDDNFKITNAVQYGFSFDISSLVTTNMVRFDPLEKFKLLSSVQRFENINETFTGYNPLTETDLNKLNIRKSTNKLDEYLNTKAVNYLSRII